MAQLTTQETQALPPTDRTTREIDELQRGRTRAITDSRIRRESGTPATAAEAQAIAAAQAIATSANVSCEVTEATLLGQTRTRDRARSYEAACAAGPGYILIATTPPQAIDCVLLAGQAEIDRARDPAAEIDTQCVIPQNTDVLRVLSAYAAEAGIACTVDQGASVGKAGDNVIYEVGCNGADGYRLERLPSGWKKTECAVLLTQNGTCQYSTAAEQAATLNGRIANTVADACAVTESRFMGSAGESAFYEAKCGAGNGYIVRFDPQFAVQQLYPCETAQRVGGGCRLTVVAAAAAPATQP
jgi:hypothetical protein